MAKAIGIGGLFFRADDPTALADWYRGHLGIDVSQGCRPQAADHTVFAPFKRDTDYFAADRQWMLKPRVDDLTTLISALNPAGTPTRTRADRDGAGTSARIHDPEANPVQRWHPPA